MTSNLHAYISANFAFQGLKFSGYMPKSLNFLTKPNLTPKQFFFGHNNFLTKKTLKVSHKKTRLSHPPTLTSKDAPWSKLSIKV